MRKEIIGPSHSEVRGITSQFSKEILIEELWAYEGGPVWGVRTTSRDIDNRQRRFVITVALDQEPTEELLNQYQLPSIYREIPVSYKRQGPIVPAETL